MRVTQSEYNRIHKWLERNLLKIGICFYCGAQRKTEWSNIDHEYRQDPTEYQELCSKCHYHYDVTMFGAKTSKGRNMKEWLYWNPIENFYP